MMYKSNGVKHFDFDDKEDHKENQGDRGPAAIVLSEPEEGPEDAATFELTLVERIRSKT
jgi:hypothetical protein